jgi:hypothetical protein
MIEKINVEKIRTHYQEDDGHGNIAGGDDTRKSLQTLAFKLNEIIDYLNYAYKHNNLNRNVPDHPLNSERE